MKDVIEKIQIQNVGTNEKLDIELSPQVTTIIGKSYIGKSWILRALRLVALNKPSGTSYISWGTDKAKVKLHIDGKRIIRIRSKNTNMYRLSGKKKPYEAFGNSVPKDIAEILNLSGINFQSQHSTKENRIPFWFCETPGEVSRQLNSIVNLELIDSTLANIATEFRKTDLLIKITEEGLDKAIKQRKELDYIEDLNRDLENVENLQRVHEENTRKHRIINEKIILVTKYRDIRKNMGEQATDGLKAMSICKTYLKITDSVEKLSKLIKSGQTQQSILKTRPPSFLPIIKLRKRLVQTSQQFHSLSTIIDTIKERREQKCQKEETLKTLTEELKKIRGTRCPLCGKK